ncbi:MAG: ABC transporter permease [Desulfobacterales bacterium]|nr:ABC transporter permease [Desulfobacterales bacterium]MDJ0914576.1 ABC transporter permease [Desulfobacterales bacterium]
MINLDAFSWRFTKIWKRNLVTYQKIWKVSFITPLIEPLLYVVAFGLGFSGLIGDVRYGGLSMTYTQFMAPALIATAVMYNAFFETTYASFVRMYYQKTFDGMLATPVSLEEIILAEIAWSATKASAAATLMTVVLGLAGFIQFPGGLLIIPIAFLGGLAFGAVGLFFTGIIPSIEMFNLPIFLFVTPMFLFSGTFFPVSNLPGWAQPLALLFPLHHLVELVRFCSIGTHETGMLLSFIFLIGFFILFTLSALIAMRYRLIK